jgi:uncharacterized protein (DUF952 family)
MRCIYHLVPRSQWEKAPAGPFEAESLKTEGFIHCSNGDQVARVANLFFAGEADLVVLGIDADSLGTLLRDEDIGTGEPFPHVYGPIERSAILEVKTLSRGPENLWFFPPEK